MEMNELAVAGCFVVVPRLFRDARGRFVKPVVSSVLRAKGLRSDFVEQYYSTSAKGVIRGMHFQLPPHDHAKLVYCAAGAVQDVLLDLRVGSPTFGRYCTLTLSDENAHAVYIPSGVAHGFVGLQEPGLLVYNVTSEYAPTHDSGVRWDSFGFDWPVGQPVMSDRDRAFPTLAEFESPFRA
ncbi:MAG: dTDP-4-dehydrorhamnose 3,5-epimerase [Stagnimonas sp.]|nr:dTDP-4-dehydrorhamnose 3,5-epimerase [Stagnimonas sp.]